MMGDNATFSKFVLDVLMRTSFFRIKILASN